MTVQSSKVCKICHKDVTQGKRVKDAKGNYYCPECHAKAVQRQTPPHVPAPAPSKPALELDEPEVTPVQAPLRPQPQAPAPRNKPMPDVCPNCGAKVFPNRKLCIKCGRDVTKMDKLLAIQAEAAKGPSNEEKIATIVGKVAKIGLGLFLVAAVVFTIWVLYSAFVPVSAFGNYPTKREAAVREFLGYIQDGSPKALEKAFYLVDMRERSGKNTDERTFYDIAHTKMHKEFEQKYGAGWLSKAKITKSEYDGSDAEVGFTVQIGEDAYHILTHVQLGDIDTISNMTGRGKVSYAEDGKNHFGILGVDEYEAHPSPKVDPKEFFKGAGGGGGGGGEPAFGE